jgi:hypothetical protein
MTEDLMTEDLMTDQEIETEAEAEVEAEIEIEIGEQHGIEKEIGLVCLNQEVDQQKDLI